MTFPAREVDAHVKKLVRRFHTRRPSIPLNAHDWDDIAQSILIHVAAKWSAHKGDKWHQWVAHITRNQLINAIRDRMVRARRLPMGRLVTRVAQCDVTGHDELIYEPDMAAQDDGIARTMEALDELPEGEARFLRAYMVFGTWKRTGRVNKVSWNVARYRGLLAAAKVRAML